MKHHKIGDLDDEENTAVTHALEKLRAANKRCLTAADTWTKKAEEVAEAAEVVAEKRRSSRPKLRAVNAKKEE